MTTPPQPNPAADKPVGQFLRPLRDLSVYALVGAPAVFLFVALIDLFGSDFVGRTRYSFSGFVNLETIFFPLAAVVLALGVQPVHPKARLITLIAVVEYAVAAFFGVVFGLFFGVSGLAALDAASAFTQLLARAAWLAVLGLAAYAVVQIWLGRFAAPKPQPGVYGQPYGQPSYGQPPYGQPPYGQPSYGAVPPGGYPPAAPTPHAAFQPGVVPHGGSVPGQPFSAPPVATQPFHAQQPFSAQPAPYGQYPPVPPPGWGQPPAPPTPSGPAAPAPGGPATPPPPPPFAEPTRPVSAAPQAPADHTAVLPPDRPGFGPADQDPPRQ